uniref:nucleic acid/nucleotide deaminase domain-containing protein n=1 Tax=Herbidospora sakaeratensis TaxID=564415 RepID=UPI0007847427|nr:nucleic acid/nucleotide deaminase domain-containing protein [Herbidospora sakaeratensis]
MRRQPPKQQKKKDDGFISETIIYSTEDDYPTEPVERKRPTGSKVIKKPSKSTYKRKITELDDAPGTGTGDRMTRAQKRASQKLISTDDLIESPPAPIVPPVSPELQRTRTEARVAGYTLFATALRKKVNWAVKMAAALGIDGGPKSLRRWLEQVGGLHPASTVPEVIEALASVDAPVPARAWQEIAAILGHTDATAEKVLARIAVEHATDGDADLQGAIADFCAQAGLDHAAYLTAYGRLGGLNLFGAAATDKVTTTLGTPITSRLGDALSSHLSKLHGPFASPVVARGGNNDLDRLAWVLANMKSARQCVALITVFGQEIRLFANQPDAKLGADFLKLLNLAEADAQAVTTQVEKLFNELAGQKLGQRKSERISDDVLHKAERRLRKTIRFLGANYDTWADLRVRAHTAATSDKVHAETQAADVVLRHRDKALAGDLSDTEDGDLRYRQDVLEAKLADGKRAEFGRLVANAQLAIGISKLCCFKCWLMLLAAGKKSVQLPAAGSHGKVYGWPAPAVLAKSSILLAFLQLDTGALKDDDEEVLAAAIATKKGRQEIVNGISTWMSTAGLESDYPSSEDEKDLDLSLWQSYYDDVEEFTDPEDEEEDPDQDEDEELSEELSEAEPVVVIAQNTVSKKKQTLNSG